MAQGSFPWINLEDTNGTVMAITPYQNGHVIAGEFSMVGTVPANHIAYWDGQQWHALGSGMNHSVSTLATSGNTLYAGGYFTTAGGVQANYIAKWDGNQWSSLGNGLNSFAYDLLMHENILYVGGNFTLANGISSRYISSWNGNQWAAVGPGFNNAVGALALHGNALHAGGWFTSSGGKTMRYIARWNPATNLWAQLGTGLNGKSNNILVQSMVSDGNTLYAGGKFTTAGGLAASNMARWNGTVWSAMGSGFDNTVLTLLPTQHGLFAGGRFKNSGNTEVNHISQWDGSKWLSVHSGMNGPVFDLVPTGDELLAGGFFSSAGGNLAENLAKLRLVKTVPALTWETPASFTHGLPLSDSQQNASSTVPGTITYIPAPGTVLNAGIHLLEANFLPQDEINYTTGSISVFLEVLKATPAVSWETPQFIVQGTPLSSLQLNVTSSVEGTFTYDPPAGTILSVGRHILLCTFTPLDESNFNTATVQTSLEVSKTTPTLSWETPQSIVQGIPLSSLQLNAASSVEGTFTYDPPAGTILSVGRHILLCTFTPLDESNFNTATIQTSLDVTMPTHLVLTGLIADGVNNGQGHHCQTLEAVDAIVPAGAIVELVARNRIVLSSITIGPAQSCRIHIQNMP